ncbi:MAG: response regulator, partial [Candidatus Eisenbacteria bacterium]|nr:response regulator [Candidatus Eisenbacteria bacterium]
MTTRTPNGSLIALVVDSDATARAAISGYLMHQGIRVAAETDGLGSAVNLIRGLRPHLFFLDLPRRPEEALETVRRLRADFPELGIVASSPDSNPDLILRAIRAGAQEFLVRPLDVRELGEAVGRLASLARNGKRGAEPEGKIILVSAGKGGLGTTSIAANLGVALAHGRGAQTVLFDLTLQR